MREWVMVLVTVMACGGESKVEGALGEACYPNATCNQGLVCLSGICGEATAGVEGGPCYPNSTCNAGLVCTQDTCVAPVCGNAVKDPEEQCDDGNTADGDGCSADCTFENCGDRIVSDGEDCDDGGESATCNLDCTAHACGDGTLNRVAGEQCDNGVNNAANADCLTDCKLNVCGDGKPNTIGPDNIEQCDDGDSDNLDGCSVICTAPSCGNGITEMGEQCDDGNLTNLDACLNGCTLPTEAKLCLDGTTGRGTSEAVNTFAPLTAATLEFWYRSADPNTPATAQAQLVFFHPAAYVGGNYPALSVEIADATALAMGSLSGRALGVAVDARGGPQNQLNARGFDIDASLPGFDEKGWHHYAVVFTGVVQRAFIDGVELTTAQQRDGSQATTFASAFGSTFTNVYGSLFMSIGYFARDNIRYARGGFSDLRLSNIARYTTTFVPPFRVAADANTVLLLPMNENTGTTSIDRSSNGYDVTWTGGHSWSNLLLPCP